jgi:2-polyprenyl-3-methyl-5-hydroxy-6-metoxy-1,4-benzoquinol methylase
MSEISADVVRIAYRLFLDREAESDTIVLEQAAVNKTYQDLRNAFLSSPEFRRLCPSIGPAIAGEIDEAYWAAPAPVEVYVGRDTLSKLTARVRDQWSRLGQTEPYWSVLTHDDYLISNIDANKLSRFYETGQKSAGLIELFEQRCEVRANRGTCLELGCGVGRVTIHLAARFKRVIAADISPGNLAICKQKMQQAGISNVETVLLDSPEAISKFDPVDFFFSLIVLQHNPPPIQKIFIENALLKINKGGGCLFQTPAPLPGYTFSAERFLMSDQQVMDVHCLPKPVVMKLIHDCGLVVLDVQMDPWLGCFGSYTYFAMKAN